MIKVALLIALAIAGINAQNVAQGEAAPEPYSYGYETESHAAAEQRDPNGRVSGYYTLADADGRQRRVEYVADEAGFRAKVQTNEVGTKSENSADVETLAAPPTREQLVYQAPPAQQTVAVAQQGQRVASQVVKPARAAQVAYVNQPYAAGYGYNGYTGYNGYNGYTGYTNGYTGSYGLANSQSGYYPAGYGYANNGQYVYRASSSPAYTTNYGYSYGVTNPTVGYATYGTSGYYGVGNYNNHLPSSYYRSVGQVVPSSYGSSSGVVSGGYVAAPVASTAGNYRAYQTVAAAPAVSRTVSSASNLGSSNYILLQKRETAEPKKSS